MTNNSTAVDNNTRCGEIKSNENPPIGPIKSETNCDVDTIMVRYLFIRVIAGLINAYVSYHMDGRYFLDPVLTIFPFYHDLYISPSSSHSQCCKYTHLSISYLINNIFPYNTN